MAWPVRAGEAASTRSDGSRLSGGPDSSRARGIRGEDAEVTAPEGQQKSQGPCPRSEGASRDVRFLVDTQDEEREYITMPPAVDKHLMPHQPRISSFLSSEHATKKHTRL